MKIETKFDIGESVVIGKSDLKGIVIKIIITKGEVSYYVRTCWNGSIRLEEFFEFELKKG